MCVCVCTRHWYQPPFSTKQNKKERSRDIVHRGWGRSHFFFFFFDQPTNCVHATLSIGWYLPTNHKQHFWQHTEERSRAHCPLGWTYPPKFVCIQKSAFTTNDDQHFCVCCWPNKQLCIQKSVHATLSIGLYLPLPTTSTKFWTQTHTKICPYRRAFTTKKFVQPEERSRDSVHYLPTTSNQPFWTPPPLKHKRAFTTTNQTFVHTEERSRKQCPLGCTYLFGTTPPTYIYIYIYNISPS